MEFAAGLFVGFVMMLIIHRSTMASIEADLDSILRGEPRDGS